MNLYVDYLLFVAIAAYICVQLIWPKFKKNVRQKKLNKTNDLIVFISMSTAELSMVISILINI